MCCNNTIKNKSLYEPEEIPALQKIPKTPTESKGNENQKINEVTQYGDEDDFR